jgi:Zn-dependent protease with chaperone function
MSILSRLFRKAATPKYNARQERVESSTLQARKELMGRHLASVESIRHRIDNGELHPPNARLEQMVTRLCNEIGVPIPATFGIVEKTNNDPLNPQPILAANYYAAFRKKNRAFTVSEKAMELPDDELEALVAHELGHAKKNFKIALGDRIVFAGLWARLPMSIMAPISGRITQAGEHEADHIARKHAGPRGFAKLFMRIQSQEHDPKKRDEKWADFIKGASWLGRLTPKPLRRFLGKHVRSHPPTEDRIAMAVPDEAEREQLLQEIQRPAQPGNERQIPQPVVARPRNQRQPEADPRSERRGLNTGHHTEDPRVARQGLNGATAGGERARRPAVIQEPAAGERMPEAEPAVPQVPTPAPAGRSFGPSF